MNAKRILALIGVILLLGMYASTLVFALIKSPHSAVLFKASIYCTIVVPVIIYMGTLIFKNSKNKKELPFTDPNESDEDDGENTAG